jgi:GntR family transcriptional regulator, transcriptional repressor for pyruvate dehydrogenase complex
MRSPATPRNTSSAPIPPLADAEFHLAIVQALGNGIFSTNYVNLYALITDVIRLSVRVPSKSLQEGLEEHEVLYYAIRSGNPDLAKSALTEHLENSKSYLQDALAGTAF